MQIKTILNATRKFELLLFYFIIIYFEIKILSKFFNNFRLKNLISLNVYFTLNVLFYLD